MRDLDKPLDEYVGYATHLLIRCAPPSCNPPCSHSAHMLTADLYAMLPQCRTYRDFKNKLRCSKCGARGWLRIEAARRS